MKKYRITESWHPGAQPEKKRDPIIYEIEKASSRAAKKHATQNAIICQPLV